MCFASSVNNVLRRYPTTAFAYTAAVRYTIFGVGSVVCSFVGVPTELALGFAVTRPLKRVRLPLDLASAYYLSRLVPTLAKIEISQLLTGGLPQAEQPAFFTREKYPRLHDLWQRGGDLIDRYGAAYFVGRDLVGLLVVTWATCMFALDPFTVASSLMNWTGVTPEFAATLSSIAGGALCASASTPLVLVSLPTGVPLFAEKVCDVDDWVRRNTDFAQAQPPQEAQSQPQQAKGDSKPP
ncbi:hypothetical protein DIPPA_35317 [Diplonema papillatum]|nr:hypothetical protein DIPPA_35317 [Diplonema papillatum]